MKLHTSKSLFAGAALAGIMSGGFLAQANAAVTVNTPAKSTASAAGTLADEKKDIHDCAGKNTCKGKGGCKTGDNGCKGKNSCKGKGGCEVKK